MKFRFCGELDAPDWLLKEIELLSKISVVRIKLIIKEVLSSLLTGRIDFAKIISHTATASLNPSEVKACIAALTFILNNGAKYNVDADTLTNELQQLGLPKEHCDTLVNTFMESKPALRLRLQSEVLTLPRIIAVDWRVDYILSSSDLVNVNAPAVRLNVRTNEGTESHTFEVNGEKFKALLTELQAAHGIMESLRPLEQTVG